MRKVATINISQDGCGTYVLKLLGADAEFFKIVDKELYFLLEEPNICKTSYSVTVSMQDILGRFTPKNVVYNLNTPHCSCSTTTSSTTTTSTTTTTTTQAPITTTTTTLSPCQTLRYSVGLTNVQDYGSYYTGNVLGTTVGTIWGNNIHGYTDDSNFSVAAVHAGLISIGQQAIIRINRLGTKNNFPSTTSNGIRSVSWSTNWCAVQISLISATTTTTTPAPTTTTTTTTTPAPTTTTTTTTTTIQPVFVSTVSQDILTYDDIKNLISSNIQTDILTTEQAISLINSVSTIDILYHD